MANTFLLVSNDCPACVEFNFFQFSEGLVQFSRPIQISFVLYMHLKQVHWNEKKKYNY